MRQVPVFCATCAGEGAVTRPGFLGLHIFDREVTCPSCHGGVVEVQSVEPMLNIVPQRMAENYYRPRERTRWAPQFLKELFGIGPRAAHIS